MVFEFIEKCRVRYSVECLGEIDQETSYIAVVGEESGDVVKVEY